MITLETSKCDCIRKENGKWGFFRTLPQAEFASLTDAQKAIKEIESQGICSSDIEIVSW